MSSNQRLLQHLQLFSIYLALSVLESWLDLSGLRNVIGYVTVRLAIGHFLLVVLWNQASISVSEIFNGECDAMIW